MNRPVESVLPYVILGLFCTAGLIIRPLLPPDETRYLTVAWEMYVSKSLFLPTLNFLPYHHKPPLLFWMINAAWALFGPSRAAAMTVVFAISAANLALSARLASVLFPGRPEIARRAPWLMLGSFFFIFYSSLILFDLLLTATVIASFLMLHRFAATGRLFFAGLAGLCIGLGVLAKGPVVLVHVAWPIALYPLWRDRAEHILPRRFYKGVGLALGAALVPVAIWFVPLAFSANRDFLYSLVWRQAAGRISGNMEAAHSRPIGFYLLFLPIFFLPWILSPALWRSKPIARLRALARAGSADVRPLRFIAFWACGTVATFSLISGKQPHYILPLLPLFTAGFALFMDSVSLRAIAIASTSLVALTIAAQAVLKSSNLDPYDLSPVAAVMRREADADWAVVGTYEGELNFLARRTKPVDVIRQAQAANWLKSHSGGFLVVTGETQGLDAVGIAVLETQYRHRPLAILHASEPQSSPAAP